MSGQSASPRPPRWVEPRTKRARRRPCLPLLKRGLARPASATPVRRHKDGAADIYGHDRDDLVRVARTSGGSGRWTAGDSSITIVPSVRRVSAHVVSVAGSAVGDWAQFGGGLRSPGLDRVPVAEVAVFHPQGRNQDLLGEAEPVPVQTP